MAGNEGYQSCDFSAFKRAVTCWKNLKSYAVYILVAEADMLAPIQLTFPADEDHETFEGKLCMK
jgi:hypothetical protein